MTGRDTTMLALASIALAFTLAHTAAHSTALLFWPVQHALTAAVSR